MIDELNPNELNEQVLINEYEEPVEINQAEPVTQYQTIKIPKNIQNENSKYISTQLQRAGFNNVQIAGILGNLAAESMFNPTAFNSAGGGQGALGIAQWRGDRLKISRKPLKNQEFLPQI